MFETFQKLLVTGPGDLVEYQDGCGRKMLHSLSDIRDEGSHGVILLSGRRSWNEDRNKRARVEDLVRVKRSKGSDCPIRRAGNGEAGEIEIGLFEVVIERGESITGSVVPKLGEMDLRFEEAALQEEIARVELK